MWKSRSVSLITMDQYDDTYEVAKGKEEDEYFHELFTDNERKNIKNIIMNYFFEEDVDVLGCQIITLKKTGKYTEIARLVQRIVGTNSDQQIAAFRVYKPLGVESNEISVRVILAGCNKMHPYTVDHIIELGNNDE